MFLDVNNVLMNLDIKMQTFLPYDSFIQSAKCLDMKRLSKQRVECYQILNILTQNQKSWQNHPAVLMWKGYIPSLVTYGIDICNEWISRGYKDTCKEKILKIHETYVKDNKEFTNPKWLGNLEFHNSHKSNLLRKNFDYYNQFKWNVKDNLSYFWPTKEGY